MSDEAKEMPEQNEVHGPKAEVHLGQKGALSNTGDKISSGPKVFKIDDSTIQVDAIEGELRRLADEERAEREREQRAVAETERITEEAEIRAYREENRQTLHNDIERETESFANGLRNTAKNLPPDAKENKKDGSTIGKWQYKDEKTAMVYSSELKFKQGEDGEVHLLGYKMGIDLEMHSGDSHNNGNVKIDFSGDAENKMQEITFGFYNTSYNFHPYIQQGSLRDFVGSAEPLFMHYARFSHRDKPSYHNELILNVGAEDPEITFQTSRDFLTPRKRIYRFDPNKDKDTFLPTNEESFPKDAWKDISRTTFVQATKTILDTAPFE